MNKDIVYILSFVLVIVFSPLVSLWLLREVYKTRVKASKATNDFSELVVPREISKLIDNFNPSIAIRISDDEDTIPQAAFWGKQPSYIILPRQFLDKTHNGVPQFESNHLLALVAHELGHY